MLRPVLVTAPVALSVVSLAEAKAWCRVDHSDEDGLITSLVNAVESYLDGYAGILNRVLAPQTWSQQYDSFEERMALPMGYVQSVTDVKYFDTNNAEQTLAGTVYQLLSDEIGSYVSLKSGQSWPSIYSRDDAIKITWLAGYASASDVPAAIKVAMRMMITQWYDGRDGTDQIPVNAMSLLAPFRRVGV